MTAARIVDLEVHRDNRGDVREVFRASWTDDVVVRQMTATFSYEGALRGMHYHERQTDVWYFASGRALVQLYDPRGGIFETKVIHQGRSLVIPPGVAHGWQALEPTVLIYGLTHEYDGGSDEHGFYPFDDEYVGASMWVPTSLISERDRQGMSLKQFRDWLTGRDIEATMRKAVAETIERYEPALRRLAEE